MLNTKINTENIPKLPGVYKMKNIDEKIIYIGKAKNLFNRIKQYTQKNLDSKTEKMTSLVFKIETIITKNELEAIILEASLIKEHKPKYNIIEKDDKSNCYIELEKNIDFPRIKITRKTNPSNSTIGPFIKKSDAKKIIQTISPVFKIRTCNDLFFKTRKKPCIEFETKRCSAPCVNIISKEEYKKDANKMEKFIKTKNTKELQKEIKEKIKILSENENYEMAKNELEKIKILQLIEKTENKEDFDLIFIKKTEKYFTLIISSFRYGTKTETESFVFNSVDFFQQFFQFVECFYKKRKIPNQIFINKSMDFFSFQQNQQQ